MDQENNCEYVSSRGILKSCDIHSVLPISTTKTLSNYDFSALRAGATIYVCGTAIHDFIEEYSHKIRCPYVLVSGDCDATVPSEILNDQDLRLFLDSPNLIHWFSQNCTSTSHRKLSQIPIGLDYHTVSTADHEWGPKMSPTDQEAQLKAIRANSRPTYERECRAYANFHFAMTTKYSYDRGDAINQIPADLIHYEPHRVPRYMTWINQSQFAFVVSPHGNGLDCHRTWEAIALGCIPIVKTSPLDPLYDGLPVLIVQQWSDITPELLKDTLTNYRDASEFFHMEILNLSYWMNKIKKMQKIPDVQDTHASL